MQKYSSVPPFFYARTNKLQIDLNMFNRPLNASDGLQNPPRHGMLIPQADGTGLPTLNRRSHGCVIELHVQMPHPHRRENHLRVRHHILRVHVLRDLQLQTTDVYITAQGPEVRFLHRIHARETDHLLVALRKHVIQPGGLPLHEDRHRILDQRQNAQSDQDRYEHGADRVGYHPAEHLHEDGGHDHADAAQGVREDVEEDALHDLRVARAQIDVRAVVVGVAMGVVGVAVGGAAVGVTVGAAPVGVAVLEGVDAH